MKRWPTRALGDLISLEYGKALKAEDRSGNGRYPVYGSNGVVGSHSEAVVKGPTIVVGRKGAIGEAHLAQNGCWPIDTAFYTQFRQPDVVSLQYLQLWFRTVDLKSLAITATIPGLNRNTLYAQQVPVPPLPEQERIVKLLDEADELRKLRAQADRRTAALLPALFHQMFGDPRANPRGWPVSSVEGIAVNGKRGVTTGPFGTQLGSKDFTTEGPEVFGIYSIGDANAFRPGGKKRISRQKFAELARFDVVPDDVLISRMGTVGKVCVVPDPAPKGIVSYHLIRVRLHPEKCDPQFFAQFLSVTEAGGAGLSQSAKGAIMSGINAAIVASFSVPVPPLSLQKEFAQRVTEVRQLEAAQAATRRHLDALFQSLLHRAFNGEL